MTTTATPTFQIPSDVIAPIIQAHVSTAVGQALDGHKALIDGLIAQILNAPVDREGKVAHYATGTTYIQHLMQKVVRDAVESTLKTELAKHQDTLRKHLVRELTNSKSPLVKQLVEGMLGALTDPGALKYRLSVTYDQKGDR